MLQKHLIDEGKLQYANFVSDLSKLMVRDRGILLGRPSLRDRGTTREQW